MTITINIASPLSEEDKSILAGVARALGGMVPPGVATTLPSADKPSSLTAAQSAANVADTQTASQQGQQAVSATDAFFPVNYANASFPSPENSRIVREADGSIGGKPYLLDKTGAVHNLVPVTPDFLQGYTVNGARAGGGGVVDASGVYNEIIVRQGLVYAQRASGQWQHFNPDMGGMYNSGLPDAFVASGAPGSAGVVPPSTVAAPTRPTPSAIAPGSSGNVLTVGVGKTFAMVSEAIAAATPGDTVLITPGTYNETPPAIKMPLHIKGDGGPFVIDCTGLTSSLAFGKGCFVPTADCILENGRVTGVAMDQDGAQLTSAVRPDIGCGYLTLKNMEIDGNQSGLGTGGDINVVVDVHSSHFHKNGLLPGNSGNGYTHNFYCGANTSLSLFDVISDDPTGGHAVKSRGYELIVQGGSFEATDAAVFDIPQGTVKQATITGATLTKPAGANNHAVIDYASENTASGNGGLLLSSCIINDMADNPFMLIGANSVVSIDAATKSKIAVELTAQGGKIAYV